MNDMQAKLDAIEVEGSQSGGGLVKVRASAKGRILGVEIDESLMKPEEKQMVEDLVTGGVQRCARQSRQNLERRNEEGGRAEWACRLGLICQVWASRILC